MIPIPIIDGITDLAGKIVDHFFPPSMSEEEKARAKREAMAFAQQALFREKTAFRSFILDYEGRARDIPKSLVWLRSSIRPVLTYAITGAYICGWLGIKIGNIEFTPERMTLLKPALLLVLGFWFGERLLSRSGIVDAVRK